MAANSEGSETTTSSLTELPGMAYRSWFLLVMTLLSASVVAERYMMVVLVEPIRRDLQISDFAIAMVKDFAIAIVYIIAVIPLSRVADRWSKRKLVAIAAVTWSVAMLICGKAQSLWLLLVGRAGIGLGEGAFTPPSQSWIADLFPVNQRATALAIFLLGASAGQFIGPMFGGWAAEEYGWQQALILGSIPGFILAPIVWFTLRDVPLGLADGHHRAPPEPMPFVATVKQIWAIPTMPPLIFAAGLNTLLTLGLIGWAPAFMERTHGMSGREVGGQLGLALMIGSAIGHTLGGPLSDILGRRDLRWYVWLMTVAGLLATLVAFVALNGPKEYVLGLFGLNLLIGGMSAAPLLAVVAGLPPAQSRSTAVAILMVAINVIGLGAVPVFVGWLSDVLRPGFGEESLRWAMQAVLLVVIPSTILSLIAASRVRKDFAAVGITSMSGAERPAAMH
jgi:MFS family permease